MKLTIALLLVLATVAPAAAQERAEDARSPQDDGRIFRWDDHPTLEWPGRVRVEFRGRVQIDGRASTAAVERGNGDALDVGRRRVGVQVRIAKVVDVEVERELERHQPWRDVFVDATLHRGLHVQAGQFKLPFGLEETTSGGRLDFVYRSLASSRLAPGHDRGAMVHGRLLDRAVRYEAGVFAHDGDNARPDGGSRVFGARTLAARVTAEPFRRSRSRWSDLEVGLATTRSRVPEGFPALRGRSLFGVSFFDADIFVQGQRRRTAAQARWRPGPFAFTTEYIRVSDERRGQGVAARDLTPFVGSGWYVSAASNVRAVRLAVRTERLQFGSATAGPRSTSARADTILGNHETALTAGATWTINRWLSVQGNVIRERIGDPEAAPAPSARFWSRVLRCQMSM